MSGRIKNSLLTAKSSRAFERAIRKKNRKPEVCGAIGYMMNKAEANIHPVAVDEAEGFPFDTSFTKDEAADTNPPYGEKSGFRRVTVTLPPALYERLVQESARRKIAGEPNQLLSAMLREAVNLYLKQLS